MAEPLREDGPTSVTGKAALPITDTPLSPRRTLDPRRVLAPLAIGALIVFSATAGWATDGDEARAEDGRLEDQLVELVLQVEAQRAGVPTHSVRRSSLAAASLTSADGERFSFADDVRAAEAQQRERAVRQVSARETGDPAANRGGHAFSLDRARPSGRFASERRTWQDRSSADGAAARARDVQEAEQLEETFSRTVELLRLTAEAIGYERSDLHALIARLESEQLEARLGESDEAVTEMAELQERLGTELEEIARQDLERLEDALSPTGLDVSQRFEQLLDQTPGVELGLEVGVALGSGPDSGLGGPFVPFDDLARQGDSVGDSPIARFISSIERLDFHVTQLRAIDDLVERLPLALPVQGARLTSRFGRRRDPFNRRMAFHEGIDFAASTGTPISAPAPGVVVSAGWLRGYGRVVEIQHGFGVLTRYAHLRRIAVKRGDPVQAGTPIGAIGRSGRATSPHLHYEIHIDGRAVDPGRFLDLGVELL